MLERAVLLAKGKAILPSDLPELADKNMQIKRQYSARDSESKILNSGPDLETVEKAYIYYVLCQNDWHKANAARVLGIDSSTLYRKIERYGFKTPENCNG
jgi:DNA-binding NtrC family response regulator